MQVVEAMSKISGVPVPFINYLYLIQKKKSPYYDLIFYLVDDMEKNYNTSKSHHGFIYAINPRRLKKEMEDKIPNKKLTVTNISRTILALLYGSKLRKNEDYYVTTSSGGRRNYHIKVNRSILSTLRMQL